MAARAHTQVHIQLTFLAVSQRNGGMLPNVFGFLARCLFQTLSPPSLTLTLHLSLSLCVSLLPLQRKPAVGNTCDRSMHFLNLFFIFARFGALSWSFPF